jgi:hypothetical protein
MVLYMDMFNTGAQSVVMDNHSTDPTWWHQENSRHQRNKKNWRKKKRFLKAQQAKQNTAISPLAFTNRSVKCQSTTSTYVLLSVAHKKFENSRKFSITTVKYNLGISQNTRSTLASEQWWQNYDLSFSKKFWHKSDVLWK